MEVLWEKEGEGGVKKGVLGEGGGVEGRG